MLHLLETDAQWESQASNPRLGPAGVGLARKRPVTFCFSSSFFLYFFLSCFWESVVVPRDWFVLLDRCLSSGQAGCVANFRDSPAGGGFLSTEAYKGKERGGGARYVVHAVSLGVVIQIRSLARVARNRLRQVE